MRKLLFVAVAVLLLGACAKKEVKVQTEDSKLAVEAFALAENMRQAYVNKNSEAFESYATDRGLRDVNRDLEDFEKVELSFTPKWVEIELERLVLNVAWEGTWTIRGRAREGQGMAVFELTGRPLRLNRILRSSPFKNPD
jgi:hypothetical protein